MRNVMIIALAVFFSFYTTAKESVYITLGADAIELNQKSIPTFDVVNVRDDIAVVKVDRSRIDEISHLMHEKFKRCGGFVAHDNYEEAFRVAADRPVRTMAKSLTFSPYKINREVAVKKGVSLVDDRYIEKDIRHLSSYKNRYYKSETGVASQIWLYEKWKKMATNRSDVEVMLYKHEKWEQPSVILKMEGETQEAVVIGGHGDSIGRSLLGGHRAHAPGADDNASGIATVTETLRVLLSLSYKPSKTIYFISYAAEEVGLLGSKEIAKNFKSSGIDVHGVLQLDMTNYKGSDDFDIVMMSDFTNDEQNKFLGQILDHYFPSISWGYDKCGYGCSDHASWHGEGFPASVPFEAKKRHMNRSIHTRRDTIARSGNNASHAAKFAKLAVAYVIEIDS